MKITGKIILYGSWALAALLFFLYLRFPTEIARDLIVSQINQMQPDLVVDTQTVNPTFPPGLKLEPFDVRYAQWPVLSTRDFRVVPKLMSLFGEQKTFAFDGSFESGDLKGLVELGMDGKRPQTKLTVNLNAVPLDLLEVAGKWPQVKPSGDLNLYLDYDDRKGADGTAKITMDVTPAKIVFDPPIMGLEQIDFSQIQADLTLTPRMLQIRRCEAGGTQLEARISGSILFREPLESSRITLSCTLKPQPAFLAEQKDNMLGGLLGSENAIKRGIVVRISGTLDNPRYVLR